MCEDLFDVYTSEVSNSLKVVLEVRLFTVRGQSYLSRLPKY